MRHNSRKYLEGVHPAKLLYLIFCYHAHGMMIIRKLTVVLALAPAVPLGLRLYEFLIKNSQGVKGKYT